MESPALKQSLPPFRKLIRRREPDAPKESAAKMPRSNLISEPIGSKPTAHAILATALGQGPMDQGDGKIKKPEEVTWGGAATELTKVWWTQLLQRFPVLTAPVGLPPLVKTEARIAVRDDYPVYTPPYRLALKEQQFALEEVKKLKTQGIVVPVKSPYSSPVVIVRKKDQTFRLCIDYRKINAKIIGDQFPLPRIEDILTRAALYRYFSKIDLKSGFHQIPLRKSDQKYLAFAVGSELLTYTVLPFGMKTSPALFCRALCDVLRQHDNICAVYVDDVIIFSQSLPQHALDVESVLNSLAKAHFRIAPSKCLIFGTRMPFLGHIVEHGKISQDPAKTKAFSELPVPASFKAIRSFIGAANYYRGFIKDFASAAAPLYNALQRDDPSVFPLTGACLEAINRIKMLMTTSPTLLAFRSDLPVRIEVDASSYGAGAVLSQPRSHVAYGPVAYYSHRYQERERAFGARDLELFALFLAIQHWRTWLVGKFFEVHTDHMGLTFQQSARFNPRVKRWIIALSEFHFHIRHKKGCFNVIPDLLSRAFETNEDFRQLKTATPSSSSAGVVPPSIDVMAFGLTKDLKGVPEEGEDADFEDQFGDIAEYVDQDVEDLKDTAHSIVSPTPPAKGPELAPLTPDDSEPSGLDHKHGAKKVESSFSPAAIDPAIRVDLDLPSRDEWVRATERCPELRPLIDVLTSSVESPLQLRLPAKRLVDRKAIRLKEGLLVTQRGQILVPEELRIRVILLYHVAPWAAHLGRESTITTIQNEFWWPSLTTDVDTMLRSCISCVKFKSTPKLLRATLQIRQLVPLPWTHVVMDHIGPLPTSASGKKYVLVFCDVYSSWPEAFATRTTGAKETADILWSQLICRYGCPTVLQSDNGGGFRNHLLSRLAEHMGFKPSFSTPRHPSVNGAVERLNGTIKKLLASHDRKWEMALPAVLYAIRRAPKRPLHLSPSVMLLGYQLKAPPEASIVWSDGDRLHTVEDDFVADRLRAFKITRLELESQLMEAKERRADSAEKLANQRQLVPGDLVMVFAPDRLVDDTRGLRTKWLGPYPVLRQVGAVTYLLLYNGTTRVFHIRRLLLYDPSGVIDGTPTSRIVKEQRSLYERYIKDVSSEEDVDLAARKIKRAAALAPPGKGKAKLQGPIQPPTIDIKMDLGAPSTSAVVGPDLICKNGLMPLPSVASFGFVVFIIIIIIDDTYLRVIPSCCTNTYDVRIGIFYNADCHVSTSCCSGFPSVDNRDPDTISVIIDAYLDFVSGIKWLSVNAADSGLEDLTAFQAPSWCQEGSQDRARKLLRLVRQEWLTTSGKGYFKRCWT